MPHLIELFAAEHCPGCPDARNRLREFAANGGTSSLSSESSTAAWRLLADGLFATPAIVVDGKAVLYGVPTIAQLAARCDERITTAL